MSEIKERNYAVDLIRITAFSLVVLVHSFLHTEYYNMGFVGIKMTVFTFLRSFAMSCVPMFIILTGYLMSGKRICKDYYKGVIRTLFIFVIAEIGCIIYDAIAFEKPILNQIKEIGISHYSWYIDMYIGLFLIIPFLNLAYNGLDSKKHKRIFIVTLFVICCLFPTVSGFWHKTQGWWHAAYPLAYYFAGCYIREYSPRLSCLKYIVAALLSNTVFVIFLNMRYPSHVMLRYAHTEYTSAFVYITSLLLFSAILKLQGELGSSKYARIILPRISRLTLGAYLISYITDDIVYDTLRAYVHSYSTQLYFLPLTVTVSIIASLCLSYFINLICDAIFQIIKHIKNPRTK